ncbi:MULTISPECIES: LysR family transcriptional regulator [Bradyrhizobium]|uniref:DNA-binding transcriptional LysR family regulator n=1 Tax=Bradyrhizobium elkanii TaxID=29448 RepID=A0A7Y8R3P7_BRAEL|nr:LysR family transcriptional regulator [Bradyrhizobium elkanii]MBP1298163.1 DNA-binding transcriptional LysR family regulator [Bradyrhizobium elkanii]MBP2427194.1 DNA-binding transcriptional LysR family regulator [Bradyrhizobium elkanii]MCP1757350.1 DNA-binding transcriptional LysR family regulator [Bradyrhizobium elkanii]MCP1970391.1 DNA-binding transcriptional LysR family regulator [Bradyrhizobium elkanii]MCP1982863.1 DNA-binding transcriptional LysR family regulator [Bradyrhizobium elkani
MNSPLDWNDLRLVLAVAREGSLSGAARRLGVTHSTVFRRLGTIEDAIGTRLFERFRDGYAPTPAGEIAAASAARLEDEVLALERKLAGRDLRPSGPVRITTTDTLGAVLMRHLPAMRAAHPEIQPEIIISNAMANLTRREAEIAIRPTPAPSELLVGRRVADIAHAVYGSRAYLARRSDRDLSVHDWIGLDDALAGTVVAGWMRENLRSARITCRVDALPALRDAAAAGLGLALLPCYVGDLAPTLRRLTPKALAEPRSALWLLTHDDLKRTARIRATLDFLASALTSERALFEGKRAGGTRR